MLAGSISLNFKEVGGPSLGLSATKSIINPLLLFVSTLNSVPSITVSLSNAHLMMPVRPKKLV
jgi:hypothetical protein